MNTTKTSKEPKPVREHPLTRDGVPEAALAIFFVLTVAGILFSANREELPPLVGQIAPGLIALGILGFVWWCGAALVLGLQKFMFKRKILPADFRLLRIWQIATPYDGFDRLTGAISRGMAAREEQRISLQTSLDKYVGTSMSDKARRMASQEELGGGKRKVFVMFSDVRGFTRMTEQLKPEETVEILNTLFSDFEKIIREQGGEINKYIGDAAFAYFRMPHGNVEPGVRAILRAALTMMERFEYHNERFKVSYSCPVEIGLGIGVTAGEAILGNIGSSARMEFTLIGDVVNMAARLCGIAKHGQVLVSEEMAELSEPFFELAPQLPVQLKGKAAPHKPWQVLGEKLNFKLGA